MAKVAKGRGRYVLDYFDNQGSYKPKTKASNRNIDLGSSMMAELKKWKLACPPNSFNLIFHTLTIKKGLQALMLVNPWLFW